MKKNKKNIQEEAVLEDYKLDIGAKSAERSLNGHIFIFKRKWHWRGSFG